jgi:putative membrane protein
MMMYWGSDHMNGWGWALMSVGMVAFWGLLITGIVLLVRSTGSGVVSLDPRSPRIPPERVLAGRFARGEIDQPEYIARVAVLREQVRHSPLP